MGLQQKTEDIGIDKDRLADNLRRNRPLHVDHSLMPFYTLI
ncbi:hypothetical protein [Desulfopila aestuarii]|uniref:Uncharacterized protein n=1 Tax=Desulfopila aestuarii DSM 18488 TaxID=1121416 RepID=A0A1M7YGI5_9BACT|nr:hypothetical protein [Desulfopila aestuarii]SHO51754.1 hypothetical protein SAMN02745220_04210 [Desulfopila aestuarii DSM 18488]